VGGAKPSTLALCGPVPFAVHNRIHELKLVINSLSLHYRPSIIAITEVKHKTIWQTKLSEFSINGCEMYHNDFEKSPRGIILYVDCRLKSKQLFLNSKAAEHLIIEIQSKYARLVLTTIYRSPSSTDENDKAVNDLITDLSSRHRGDNIIVGDFNHHIDWSNDIKPTDRSSQQFITTMQDNFLSQHIMNPTRAIGQNKPHILNLVLTDDEIIDDIEYLSQLGKSDHAVLF